jgi:hypothetical protein
LTITKREIEELVFLLKETFQELKIYSGGM